jgi:hypothetical protein
MESKQMSSLLIGLSVDTTDLEVASEFFELFKIPWEKAVSGKKYSAILCANGKMEDLNANLYLLYGSEEYGVDRKEGVSVKQFHCPIEIEWEESKFPVYGRVAHFGPNVSNYVLKAQDTALDYKNDIDGRIIRRIGYNLFDEVRYLLTEGQSATHALTPTLEWHIALLRYFLVESKVSFVEIPPFPAGYQFICCLTHDVDFFGIRRHKFDRTLLGFIYRASVGTLIDVLRGRRSLAEFARNWQALSSLPFVFLGLMPDFWRPFEDYAKVENRKHSTFFLVPFQGRPGVAPDGTLATWRATRYGISDIHDEVKKAGDCGSELAVHGIDAWQDAETGRLEMQQLTFLTGKNTAGVRMHWLYFSRDTPSRLEEAGFDYDSTFGYNEAVGYKAGTSQVFRPIGCKNLMELPMSIMDSALFTTGRMNLGRRQALELCGRIVDNAKRFGGTLVINWHDRSLAPERLWGKFYKELIDEIKKDNRVWFATAREAVDWFRWRRSIKFHEQESSSVVKIVFEPHSVNLGAVLRIHRQSLSGVETYEKVLDRTTQVDLEVATKHI